MPKFTKTPPTLWSAEGLAAAERLPAKSTARMTTASKTGRAR